MSRRVGESHKDVLDGGRQYDVWGGVQGRTLVGECDCPAAGPDALCAHGAALALRRRRRLDPAGNALEFTAFADDSQVFAA